MTVSDVMVPPAVSGQGDRHQLGRFTARYVVPRQGLGGRIRQVRVSNGSVEVLQHGMRLPHASITADGVPNLPVLLALAEHLRQADNSEGR
jgi:hypothetical protein